MPPADLEALSNDPLPSSAVETSESSYVAPTAEVEEPVSSTPTALPQNAEDAALPSLEREVTPLSVDGACEAVDHSEERPGMFIVRPIPNQSR